MSSEDTNITLAEGSTNSTQDVMPHVFTFGMLLKPGFLLVEAQVISSALIIIWLGAHGALRRPPSAALAKAKGKGGKEPKDDQFTEGFAASDAIMLPVMAGAVLIGLYYLIEWLQDPDILNKILRFYLSTVSIASLTRLAGDALDILTSLVFPSIWADRKGNIYRIDSESRQQLRIKGDDVESTVEEYKSPFPSFLAGASLSDRTTQAAWEIRHLLTEEWTVKFAVHGLIFVNFNIKLNTLVGFLIAIMVSIAYHLTSWHTLSNLLGSAFSYSAFSIMSPTSFAIGTMVLAGLFIYDIVMVFYT